ncbi:hypothetical protein GKZ75_12565 [Kocuria indica]|uniref:Anti-sigma K factor RskA C-terminal domain-containing protein n=2 Tax=Bacteria TaxID=2 RepID=A0A6N9R2Y5_9MICC|nr:MULTISPECIES: anti-sigma factor [Kocuria]MCT1617256.1 anti-sigma factor [Kocuria marina]NDO79028.1 hypothetical protein [Kocuria indica]
MMADSSHHLTDQQLAEIAVEGSTADPRDMEHLAECAPCRAGVADLRRVTGLLSEPVEILAPPASLWSRVEDSMRESTAERASAPRANGRHAARRRKATWGAALAGLAVGTLLGGAAVTATSNLRDTPDQAPTSSLVTVGTADLEPIGGTTLHGEAVMERDQEGNLTLNVDVSELADDGYLEVWLRDENATRLVSLGAVTSRSTTVDVPEGLDLDEFPVVDVSHEHFDGDPTHSSETLLAGTMESKGA